MISGLTMKYLLISLLGFFLIYSCNRINYNMPSKPEGSSAKKTVTYLALGDSYTIGESVDKTHSFPYQLAAGLKSVGFSVSKPEIIAKTGWTTDELIEAVKSRGITKKFNLVTLLIGVNNQYRGYPQDTYRKEFAYLLNTAVEYAGGNKEHVIVLSIPDWGVTPFAEDANNGFKVSREIDGFNAINQHETEKLGITYINITPASRNAASDKSLIAQDGMHPSGKMYAEWAAQIGELVVKGGW